MALAAFESGRNKVFEMMKSGLCRIWTIEADKSGEILKRIAPIVLVQIDSSGSASVYPLIMNEEFNEDKWEATAIKEDPNKVKFVVDGKDIDFAIKRELLENEWDFEGREIASLPDEGWRYYSAEKVTDGDFSEFSEMISSKDVEKARAHRTEPDFYYLGILEDRYSPERRAVCLLDFREGSGVNYFEQVSAAIWLLDMIESGKYEPGNALEGRGSALLLGGVATSG